MSIHSEGMRRVVILGILALILAIAAGVLAFAYLGGAEQRALGRYTLMTVLMSDGDIPAGTSLGSARDQGLIQEEQFPEEFAPSNILTGVTADNADLVTPTDLSKGQILLTGDFVAAADAPELLEVPDGMVAVSLALDAAPRVGSFLIPGDFVGVFVSAEAGTGDMAVTQTRVVFPSLQVLAVADVTESGGIFSSDTQSGPLLVTLAVKPGEATKLVNAAQSGQVYLSLLADGVTVPADATYAPGGQP